VTATAYSTSHGGVQLDLEDAIAQASIPKIDAVVDYERAAKWLIGVGPTTLWANFPDTGRQAAIWFDGSDLTGVAEWMQRWNSDRDDARFNIYQHANLPRTGLSKKAEKPDIVAFRYIVGDVDGDKGRDVATAWTTIGKVPRPPSFVVMSGGGFNAYWALSEPLPNTPDTLRRVEALGKRIARLTGGDSVQNVDRVLRTPFTINWPNKAKRDRGRVSCPSGIVRQEPLR
jgi:hypothetical protein